jgi:cytochrome c peroxidase
MAAPTARAWQWDLPPGFPEPRVPDDNPMTAEKVALGRLLFYDTRLSVTGQYSCATCHQQHLAFADAQPRAVGATGELHPRGSMSLANVVYVPALTWANPNLRRLEAQALIPMFGEEPVELGLSGREDTLLHTLRRDPRYARLFPAAFPAEADPVSLSTITRALAAFQRTLISGRSPYDRFVRGDSSAVSASARRGAELFFSERLECFHCHGGFNFTGTVDHRNLGSPEVEFHNTGLYNIGGTGAFPPPNRGLREFTEWAEDEGRFRAPTLRNIAVTAPYMHDGSVPTLEAVIDHYAAGGRRISSGPYAGDGSANPHKSEFINGFTLTAGERADLLAFLQSLTDSTFLTDPRFADPWPDTLPRRRGSSRPPIP